MMQPRTRMRENLQGVLRALFPSAAVLAVHFVLWPFGVFDVFPWLDVPMHFFGGIAIGILFSAITPKVRGRAGFVMIFCFITALGWEGFELWLDPFVETVMQPGIFDTIKDLVLGSLGAVIVLLWRRFRES